MILGSTEVTQTIEGDTQGRFLKELVYVDGPQPLAMIRKRLPPDLAPRGYRAPMLLTHGFGQNRYAWHLSSRSFVNFLASEGFDVFNVDLRGHGRSRRLGSKPARSIDDYILEDFPAALDEVLRLSGRRRAFVLGHSMGGLIACAAAGRLCEPIAGIVTIGTPYRLGRGNLPVFAAARVLGLIAEHRWIEVTRYGLPIRLVGRMLDVYRYAWDSKLLPLPLRAWNPGAFEPSALREYLARSFDSATMGTLLQMMDLARSGEFRSVDEHFDYGASFEPCDVPLLVVAGTHDLLAPPPSVRPLYERSRSSDKTYRVVPLGHADLLLGREAPALTWRLTAQWLHAREHRVDAPHSVAPAG